MKILIITAITIVFTSACGLMGNDPKGASKSTNSANTSNAAAPANEAKFKAGETVVARWMKNSYYEGVIESVGANKAKVKWSDGSSPSDVDLVDIYALPKTGEKPQVTVGDIVLAKQSSGAYWNGAEITAINGDVYAVALIDGGATSNMPAEKIIKISPVAIADLKDKAATNDFLNEAQQKKPIMPADHKAKVGDKVLGEWSTNSWWSGKVTKVAGGKTTVAWEDGSTPREVADEKIMPLPTAKDAKMPVKGQFLMVKPESGSKWLYARTEEAKEGAIKITLSDGKERTVKAGEFVLLEQ